jgi:hypothetical protein
MFVSSLGQGKHIMKRVAKRTAKPSKIVVPAQARRFHRLIVEDDKIRQKLYEKFGRVRCYLYKTGRSTPNPVTAKAIEKICGLPAAGWG